jgi:4-phosphopantoate--beta-alanine ligase
MEEIAESHPRRDSLLARQKLVDAAEKGLLAESAMIAHGRGEAYDYLLGEQTSEASLLAIREVAARLLAAARPVISVNGNTVVLAGENLIRVAAVIGCPIEVNLYYRSSERVEGLVSLLTEQREAVSDIGAPEGYLGDWSNAVGSVLLMGAEEDGRIEGLIGPRSICSAEGIGSADTVLVPLEDGDRCKALIDLGKEVLVIDLNPLSRTSMMASVTIVDEVARASEALVKEVITCQNGPTQWDNRRVLRDALHTMAGALERV